MRAKTCQEAFNWGKTSRNNHPLPFGKYKLCDLHGWLSAYRNEVVYIREMVSGRAPPYGLMRCTAEDKHVWLKGLPTCVAYWLGYNLLPALDALVHDGANPALIQRTVATIRPRVLSLLSDLEAARLRIKRNIKTEYEHMKDDDPILEPLLEEALRLTEMAMAAAP